MQHEITIPLRYLQAARLFVSKIGGTRPYLKGVAITHGHVVATNSAVLAAIECESVDRAAVPEIIIPSEAIDFYVKRSKGYPTKDVTIFMDDKHGQLTNGAVVEPFQPLDGVFPDYRRLLPDPGMAAEMVQFNWSYMALFVKASETLRIAKDDDTNVHLFPYGLQPAKVLLPSHPEFLGLWQPLLEEFQPKSAPAKTVEESVEDLV